MLMPISFPCGSALCLCREFVELVYFTMPGSDVADFQLQAKTPKGKPRFKCHTVPLGEALCFQVTACMHASPCSSRMDHVMVTPPNTTEPDAARILFKAAMP